MKKYILLYLFIFFGPQVFSQRLSLTFQGGYSTFSMSSLKSFQQRKLNETPYFEKAVVSFPGNLTFCESIEASIGKRNYIGFSISYFSSGGRNNLKDYSGEYNMDMLMSGYRIGLLYRNVQQLKNRFNFYSQFQYGFITSELIIKESLILNNFNSEESKNSFFCIVPFLEPMLGILYDINNNLTIDLGIGYELDIEKELTDNTRRLNDVNVNWSGVRTLLGLKVKLN